jgi:hypothetical protein
VAKAEPAAQPESQVDAVQARAKEMLAKTETLRGKTVEAINKYAYKLDQISISGNLKLSEKLIDNIKATNRDMINRGASYEALTKFNTTIVAMIDGLRNINGKDEVADHAQKINAEIATAHYERKYEQKSYRG